MSWQTALFLIAAVVIVAWWAAVQLRYFGGIKRRFTAEFDVRRRLPTEAAPGSPAAEAAVTVKLTPALLAAVDRFITKAGESRRLDRAEAVRMLMTETLVGLDLLSADDRPKGTEPRR